MRAGVVPSGADRGCRMPRRRAEPGCRRGRAGRRRVPGGASRRRELHGRVEIDRRAPPWSGRHGLKRRLAGTGRRPSHHQRPRGRHRGRFCRRKRTTGGWEWLPLPEPCSRFEAGPTHTRQRAGGEGAARGRGRPGRPRKRKGARRAAETAREKSCVPRLTILERLFHIGIDNHHCQH